MSLTSKSIFLITAVITIFIIGEVAAFGSEIIFKNSSIYFQITKMKTTFTVVDGMGSRHLEIKKCNEEVIDKFWKGLVKAVNSLQSTGGKQSSSSKAWVKYEGIQFPVLGFEASLRYFNKVPSNLHVLFSQSRRLCQK